MNKHTDEGRKEN